jgi:hypothetical protein
MFSLGNKEAIMNGNAKFTSTVNGNKLNIKGFGTFDAANLVSAVCQRYQTPRYEAMSFTAPTAAELGLVSGNVNIPVTVNIKIKSTRNSSEWGNNFITNSRPLVLEIGVSYGDSATTVANTIAAAFDAWVAKFASSGLPFTYANSTGVITMTLVEYYLFFGSTITFKVDKASIPVTVTGLKAFDTTYTVTAGAATAVVAASATANLRAGDTVIIGTAIGNASAETKTIVSIDSSTQFTVDSAFTNLTNDKIFVYTTALPPVFDGKYLEENARMSMEDTTGAYSISAGELPIISGSYSYISFVINDTNGGIGGVGGYAKHAFLGTTRGEVGGLRQFKFTLYVLEGSDAWGATGNVDKIIEWLDLTLTAGTTLKMYLANGLVAANADAFRA